jgi:hypothetical protein
MTRRLWIAMTLVFAGIAACRPSPTIMPLEKSPESAASEAKNDSLDVLEHLLVETGDEPETAADALSELGTVNTGAETRVAKPRATPRDGLRWRVTAIEGYRSDLRAVIEKPGRFSLGLRAYGDSKVGYVRLGGWGPLRSIHVGHLNARMGERLVLGRSLGMYPVTSPSPARNGLAVTPSLSRWFGRTGIDVELRGGALTANALLVGTSDRLDTSDPGALWITLRGWSRGVRAGVTYGEELAPTGGSRLPGVVSVYAGYRSGGVESSGEVARYAAAPPFLAFRVSDTGRNRSLRWKILCFRAPYFSSTTDPLLNLRSPERTNLGARLDLTVGRSARRLTLSLIVGQLVSSLERKPYRRMMVAFSGRTGRSTSWECSFYRVEDNQHIYPTDVLVREGIERSAGETRVRFVLGLNPDRGFSHRLRVDYATGRRRGSDGVLLSFGSRFDTGRFETRWQVSAYSITPGGRGYVTRPGIGSFEFFSTVYGGGSDVSVRLRWRVLDGLSIVVYHGAAWSKEKRTYLGLDWRHR